AALGIALEVIGRFVPREGRIQDQRQEQVVPVVDDDELSAGAFDGRVVDEVLLGAVRADVSLERELARDDLLDGDLLVPAVAAVLLFTAGLGHVLGAAERAPGLGDGFPGHHTDPTGSATGDGDGTPGDGPGPRHGAGPRPSGRDRPDAVSAPRP